MTSEDKELHIEWDADEHPVWRRILSPRGAQRKLMGATMRDASCGALLVAKVDVARGKGQSARAGDVLIARQGYEPYWGRERSRIDDPDLERFLRKHWYC